MQEATIEVTRQGAGQSQGLGEIENVSKIFNDFEIEAGLEAETMTSQSANPMVVESSNSESEERSKAKHDAPAPKNHTN